MIALCGGPWTETNRLHSLGTPYPLPQHDRSFRFFFFLCFVQSFVLCPFLYDKTICSKSRKKLMANIHYEINDYE